MPDMYVKKPIPLEVYQWDGSISFRPSEGFEPEFRLFGDEQKIKLHTAEGWMEPQPRSYIVKGTAGEYWAVRKDIFENTYVKIVSEPAPSSSNKPYLSNCQQNLREDMKPYPRTCQVCGLGPCQR